MSQPVNQQLKDYQMLCVWYIRQMAGIETEGS
jgi:hypothetical protein